MLRNDNDQIIIYGAGKRCNALINWLSARGIIIDGIAVTSLENNPQSIEGAEVKEYFKFSKNAAIVISVLNKDEAEKICHQLNNNNYTNVLFIDRDMRPIHKL